MTDQAKLLLIKLLHTAVWLFFVSMIGYVLYSGLANAVSGYTWIAIGMVIVEGLILLLFSLRCPLTILVRRYSDSDRANFDIFLPDWLARYNKRLFTFLYIVGLLIVAYRQWY